MGRPKKNTAVLKPEEPKVEVVERADGSVAANGVEIVPPAPLSASALPSPTEPEVPDFDSEEDILKQEGAILEKQIAEYFEPATLRIIKRVCYYVSQVGLDFAEACMISRVKEDEYRQWMRMSAALNELMAIKELEYKAGLMITLGTKARQTGGDKIAQWLLQAKGYGPKKGTGGGDGEGDDLIAAGIEFVRRTGDSTPLVSETSGRAFVVRKRTETTIDALKGLLT